MSGYIPREQRKKILLISDVIAGFSGVANVARAIVTGTANHYNFVSIGVSQDKNSKGQRIDLCEATNIEADITDSNVVLITWDSYDDPDLIRQAITNEKPDALVFITDPRYYANLFNIAHEIQHGSVGEKGIPMCYVQIWDEFTPPFYNRAAWSSVNLSLCISKQTMLMNKIVLGDRSDKTKLEYFPHGVDINKFKPIPPADEQLWELKTQLFGNRDFKFVLFFNSRNIQRKNVSTALLAFKAFIRELPKEEADSCVFVLHTQRLDPNGTDLPAVVKALFGERNNQIVFDEQPCTPEQLNLRYNLANVTVLISEAEGFGLSGLESMATGTPIIVNMTGGIQDYCNIKDENGNWFTPNEKVWSNHNKTYTEVGDWVYPVWPKTLTLVGSIPTPYIFSSRCDFKDVAAQIKKVYNNPNPKENGAREWIQREEVSMTSELMCKSFIKNIDEMLENWEPIDRFSVIPFDGEETLEFIELPDYLFANN